ncbi:Satratoxin biosynthesis SC1 cluster protein 4 [Apiospora arundinis]|uniref:Satratoxin biosynthesis SC1 cluster protein 4 n=1 Tax=Apiospora arundinis TaxID=335852 RepID=A0ABR2IAI0_9PEZI
MVFSAPGILDLYGCELFRSTMRSNDDDVGEPGQPQVVAAFESRVPMLLSVNTVLMALATVFIFLRFYTRYVVLNRLGYDDWLALLALVRRVSIFSHSSHRAFLRHQRRKLLESALTFGVFPYHQMFVLATGVTQCWMTQHGLGRHVKTPLPPPPQPDDEQQLQTYTQLLWFSVLWYNTAVLATKLALLAQYYRVLPIRSVRRACVALLVVIGLWGLAQVMLSIFTCFPIQAYWDANLRNNSNTVNPAAEAGAEETTTVRCIPALPLAYQNAAGNIATYVAVLVLPLPALSSLRLPRAQKCLLIGIFCLGFFTCAAAAIRIKYFREYTDPTWDHVDPSILSLTELCSGTVCLCLPTLRPLVARWLPASLTSTAASVTSNNKGGGNRSTTNRSPVDDTNNPDNTAGGDPEKAAMRGPKRPPPCVRAGASYYNSNTATSTSSSRRPSASLPRSSISGSDSDFIFGLETARKAVPESTPSPSPPPLCMSIIRPSALGGGGSNSNSRRSSTAETSSVVRFAAMPSSSPPFSSSSSTFSSSAQQQQRLQRQYQQRRQQQQQQQHQSNYYVHRSNTNNNHGGGGYLRGQSSSNWLLESRVSTEIGTSSSPVPSEERRTLGSAAIRVKRMVTRRESVVAGW